VKIRTLIPLLATSLTMLGCAAKVLDLDGPAIEASDEPGVLGIQHELVENIAADGQRLYWAGYRPNVGGALQGCQKEDCAATLVTYDTLNPTSACTFSVQGGEVYWIRGGTQELMACPIAGCNGSPRVVASQLSSDSGEFDGNRFYFHDLNGANDPNYQGSIYSVPLRQPGQRQLVASGPDRLFLVGVDDVYVYWLTINDGYRPLSRARKDGTSAVETVANDVKFGWSGAFTITTNPTAIYWTNNVLAGSINRCPLAGCSGASETVTGPLRNPHTLLLDGSELYYVYEASGHEYALAACSLPTCGESLPLFERLTAPGALAMDDDYLYLATTEQELGYYRSDDVISRIRRLPKPNRKLP